MMTVKEIIDAIGDSVLYTLHAHTQYCDGRDLMENFVREAVHMGFTHYGFTPHSPIPFHSDCNMSRSQVLEYFAEIERLQAMYPQIKLFQAMEVDYLGDFWGPATEYFQELPLDYIIGSVHFIPNQEGEYIDVDGRPESFQKKLAENFHGDLRYVVDKFFEQSLSMIAAGGFQMIGHFDKIKHNAGICDPALETYPWYQDYIDQMIDAIIASGVIVEINTKAWAGSRQLFPAQRHWRRLMEAGVPMVVNSDAHYVDCINASRPDVIKALRYLKNGHNT